MNTTIRWTMILVAMFGVGAAAHEPGACQSSLSIKDAVAAMGEGVAVQPVFARGGVKGWRLYNTRNSDQLTTQAINPGDLVTHVCGVPISEIDAKGGEICCNVDTTCEFELTFKFDDHERKVLIKRPQKEVVAKGS
jgi:hypothetical protein